MHQKPEIKVSNYIIGNSIGKGSFGSVYYCMHKETKIEYAIKVLSKSALKKQAIFQTGEDEPEEINNQLTQLYHEIKFMRENMHPCLIRLVDFIEFPQQDHIYVILEIAEGVLASVYNDKARSPVPGGQLSKFPELQNLACLVMSYTQPLTLLLQMVQVSLGLYYLHYHDYVHADLKHANILRLSDGRYVLADLGLTQKEQQGKLCKQAISTAYSAPEQCGLTKQNDIWAFGVIFFMNLMGYHPAALVINYCLQNNVPYEDSHWGLFIQRNFDDVQKFYEQEINKTIKYWEAEFTLLQKLFQVQLEYNSTRSFITVLSSIIFSCFKPYDTRPDIYQIFQSIGRLYVTYYASKLEKHCQYNKQIEETLNTFLNKLNVNNVQEVLFFVFLFDFRQYKDKYLKELDQQYFQYNQINFNIFPEKQQVYAQNSDLSITESQSMYSQKIPSKVLENNALLQQYTSVLEKSIIPNSFYEPSESMNALSRIDTFDNQLSLGIMLQNESYGGGLAKTQTDLSNSIDMGGNVDANGSSNVKKLSSVSLLDFPRNPKKMITNNLQSCSGIMKMQSNKFSGIALNSTPNKPELQPIIENNVPQYPANHSRIQSASSVLEKLKRKQQEVLYSNFDLTISNFMSENISTDIDSVQRLSITEDEQKRSISDLTMSEEPILNSFETPPVIPDRKHVKVNNCNQNNVEKQNHDLAEKDMKNMIQKQNSSQEINTNLSQIKSQVNDSCKRSSFDDEHAQDISDNVISINSSLSDLVETQLKINPKDKQNINNTSASNVESEIQFIDSESSDMIPEVQNINISNQNKQNKKIHNPLRNISDDSGDFQIQSQHDQQTDLTISVQEAQSPVMHNTALILKNQKLFSNDNSSSSNLVFQSYQLQNKNKIDNKTPKIEREITQNDISQLLAPLNTRASAMSSANLLESVMERSMRVSKSTNNLNSVMLQQKYPGLKFQESKVKQLADSLGIISQQTTTNSENESDEYVYIMPAKKNLKQDIRKPKPQKEAKPAQQNQAENTGGLTARNLTVKQTHLVENDELFYQNEDVQKLHDYKVSLSARSNATAATQGIDDISLGQANDSGEALKQHFSSKQSFAKQLNSSTSSSGFKQQLGFKKESEEKEKNQQQANQASDLNKFSKSNTLNLFNVEFLGLTQRSNYFMKLDLHYTDNTQIFQEQVKVGTLFKNVAYVKDKSLDFKYDRKKDQNHVMSLGSFDNVNRISYENNDDEDSDSDMLSSDDDELVEIGGDDDTVDQILNIYTDVEERDLEKYKVNGLIARGKGKFNTLMEIDDGQYGKQKFMQEQAVKNNSYASKAQNPPSEPSSARIGENEIGVGKNRQLSFFQETEALPIPKFLSKPSIKCVSGQFFEIPRENPTDVSQLSTAGAGLGFSNLNSGSQIGISPRKKRVNTAVNKLAVRSGNASLTNDSEIQNLGSIDLQLQSTQHNTSSQYESFSEVRTSNAVVGLNSTHGIVDDHESDTSSSSSSEGDFIARSTSTRPITAPAPALTLETSHKGEIETSDRPLHLEIPCQTKPTTQGTNQLNIAKSVLKTLVSPVPISELNNESKKMHLDLLAGAHTLSTANTIDLDQLTMFPAQNQVSTALNTASLPVGVLQLPIIHDDAQERRLLELDTKYQLFDDEYNQELKAQQNMDQRLTARLTARGGFRGGVRQIDMQQGPISVRQETKGYSPEPVDLTNLQAIIYFHHAIILFNMAEFYIQKYHKNIFTLKEYKEASENFIAPIQQAQNNISQLRPLSLEDLILNYQIWIDIAMKYVQNKFMRQCSIILERMKLAVDTQPAFLRRECGWVLQNSFQLYKELYPIFDLINNSKDSEYGINLHINGQRLLVSQKTQNHDVHVYVGLQMVEQSPVIGVRHKAAQRTLAVQTCDRYLQFQKSAKELQFEQTRAQPIRMAHESYTIPKNKYYSFKFTNLVMQGDYDQYESQKVLYNLLFVSLNKQAMMPYLLLDVLIDLIFNARKFSKPSVIRTSLFDYENNFYMIVADAGCGLTEEKTETLFVKPKLIPGQREPDEYSRDFGNGSGISKAKLIVGFYGGVINVSSIDGGGTKIIIKIPMCRADN